MALGRNLFIFSNHALFRVAHALFGLQPEKAYLIFKYAVVAQAPVAVVACWILARDISGSLYTATTAALLIVFSPVFVLYSGQVMTDVPSVLVLATALIIHLRGVRQRKFWMVLVGRRTDGTGRQSARDRRILMRRGWWWRRSVLGWKFRRREVLCVAGFVRRLRVAGFRLVWLLVHHRSHYRWVWNGWLESMRDESARHPISITNFRPYLMYYFISAPLVFLTLPFAPVLEWRKRGLSPMLLLWSLASSPICCCFLNYSTIVNWRYFLTGLPAIVPLGALWLLRIAAMAIGN